MTSRNDRRAEELAERLHSMAPELLTFFRRRTSDPEDAADLLAECFLVAWRRRRQVPGDSREALMWMYGVASNVLRTQRRATRRQGALLERLRATYSESHAPAELPEVTDAIARLPGDQAELVRLVHWDGFSVVEAATILELSESTARGRYQRARIRLSEDPSIRELNRASGR